MSRMTPETSAIRSSATKPSDDTVKAVALQGQGFWPEHHTDGQRAGLQEALAASVATYSDAPPVPEVTLRRSRWRVKTGGIAVFRPARDGNRARSLAQYGFAMPVRVMASSAGICLADGRLIDTRRHLRSQ